LENQPLQDKITELKSQLAGKTNLIAFSGGIDSSVLVAVSSKVADHTVAITFDSLTLPSGEIEEAEEIAKNLGVEHRVLPVNELDNPSFTKNPLDRCYFCKKGIINELKMFRKEWLSNHPDTPPEKLLIIEGTNASDLAPGKHRPGYRALQEEGITVPLVKANLTKNELREYARQIGLSNADKPSLACLSSRIQHGNDITAEKLVRVGQAEKFIKEEFGIRVLRVRDHDGLARIEIGKNEMDTLLHEEKMELIHDKLKQLGFKYVTLDAIGYRTGSMSSE